MKSNKKIRPPVSGIVIPVRALAGLYRTDATRWESVIKELEKAKGPMQAYYAPMFNGLLAEMRRPGSGRMIMQLGQVEFGDNPTSAAVVEKSVRAFDLFVAKWLQEYPTLLEEFPDGGSGYEPVRFDEFYLKGGFHALARDRKGQEVLLAFHASKWSTNDARACYVELLTIIAEERHGMPRSSVRLLDFAGREEVKAHPTFVNVRKELVATCRLYSRVFGGSR